MRVLATALLCTAALPVSSQQPAQRNDAPTLDTVRVTAPRQRMEDLYRSKPIQRTTPTVFDRAWREPVNLKKIGDEGGVVPILVRYASKQVTAAARKIPGWKGPDQPAIARPPPLDDTQMRRALRLQQATNGAE